MDYLYGPNVIIRVFINERRRQEGQRRCGDKSRAESDATVGCDDGGRDHEPRNVCIL